MLIANRTHGCQECCRRVLVDRRDSAREHQKWAPVLLKYKMGVNQFNDLNMAFCYFALITPIYKNFGQEQLYFLSLDFNILNIWTKFIVNWN